MSYSENYHADIPYSGSVSYSYPASEHGGSGSAHFSGSVPVNVTIDVNTKPFDGSVSRFNTSIDALSGSVVAMHAAQCAAIQQTAKEVSGSLINGFFGFINVELSQQLNALDSAIKAAFGLIAEQNKAVTEIKNTMEGDYNRISSRYVRLFGDLDSECHKRIYALDKQSFNLSEKVQKQLLSESSSNTAALNLLGMEEVSSSKTFLFVSSINRRASEVLKALQEYINQESSITSLINSLLFDEEIVNNETSKEIPLCVPAIWTESESLEGRSLRHDSFIPGYIDEKGERLISEKTEGFCSGLKQSAWQTYEGFEKDALNKEFNALTESYFVDADEESKQRIYKTMLSLWQNSELVLLKRS